MNQIATDRYDRRKVLYHPKALAEILETGDTWPVTVNTGFTTYCNHSCVWCSTAYTTRVEPSLKSRSNLIIQPDVWLRNMKILAERGTKGLIIAGQGEPLLHPKAKEMLEEIADYGLKYMLFSNGQRMHDRYMDTFFKGAVAVRFSVDAATEEMHQRWHAADNSNGGGRSDFAAVVENIRRLVEEKKRRGTQFPHIGCQMICSKLTEDDFEGFAELFREVGVDYVVYKSLQGNMANRNISISALDLHAGEKERAAQARSMLSKLVDIKKKYQTKNFDVFVKAHQIEHAYVKQFNGSDRYTKCRAHPLTPMIEADGNVYLCIDLGGRDEFTLGNIYNDNIDKIWGSERRKEAISRIDLQAKCPAGCFLDEANLLLAEMADPDPAIHSMLI